MRFLKKYPTLLTGLVVLLMTVALLGGRLLMLKVRAEADEPAGRQTANANVATVVVANNKLGVAQGNTATVKDGIQYVTSNISGWQYESISVQQGIPVRWTINAPSGSLNGCNNRIIIPQYNLQISLTTGQNVVEFTPDRSGTFAFACWMGMIRSSIAVIGEDGTVAANEDDGSGQLPAGCCGGR